MKVNVEWDDEEREHIAKTVDGLMALVTGDRPDEDCEGCGETHSPGNLLNDDGTVEELTLLRTLYNSVQASIVMSTLQGGGPDLMALYLQAFAVTLELGKRLERREGSFGDKDWGDISDFLSTVETPDTELEGEVEPDDEDPVAASLADGPGKYQFGVRGHEDEPKPSVPFRDFAAGDTNNEEAA
jgi:hypothetical protein